jgi:large subunit ribosomal protein L25
VSTRPALSASKRELRGKSVARLRREGILPAVVFGHGHPSEAIQVDAREFETLRRTAGRHALIDLKVGPGRPRPVMIQSIQEHPVRRVPLHVDFHLVKMTEELTVDVPLIPVGESPAVEKLDGVLLHALDQVKVRALPADLPQTIEYDVSVLATFDDVIHARDLVLPPRVALVTDPDELVAHVGRPRIEHVAEAAPGAEAGPAAAEGIPTETLGAGG